MLKVNKKIEYALIALKFIALDQNKKSVTAREIYEKFNLPFDTLSRVLQIMSNHKILKSSKGNNGGYRLIKDLSDISYGELVEIINGEDQNNSFCEKSNELCHLSKTCNIIDSMQMIDNKIRNYLYRLDLNTFFTETKI